MIKAHSSGWPSILISAPGILLIPMRTAMRLCARRVGCVLRRLVKQWERSANLRRQRYGRDRNRWRDGRNISSVCAAAWQGLNVTSQPPEWAFIVTRLVAWGRAISFHCRSERRCMVTIEQLVDNISATIYKDKIKNLTSSAY